MRTAFAWFVDLNALTSTLIRGFIYPRFSNLLSRTAGPSIPSFHNLLHTQVVALLKTEAKNSLSPWGKMPRWAR